MALTSGFMDGQGTPDKHIVAGKAPGLHAGGDAGDSNASGEVPDVSGSAASEKAKAIFGPAETHAAPRVAGVAAEAGASTTGDGSSASIHSAFIDGDSLGTARQL